MKFNINFLPERVTHLSRGDKAAYGTIQIGDFQERFIASLLYWGMEDYRNHWREALERIVGGQNKSCLISSVTDPKNTNFIEWWPIYREGKFLHFQNQFLFLENLKEEFDPSNPYKHVSARKTINEDGQKLSEWSLPVKAVTDFLARSAKIATR